MASTQVRSEQLKDTAVTPGTYGDATNVSQITVNAEGQITNATDVAISGASLEVKEVDGVPDVSGVTQIIVTNGKLTDNTGGSVSLDLSGGGSLEVKEADGTPDVTGVTLIEVTNGKLTDNGGGSVSLDLSGGGGGSVATDTIWDAKGDLAVGTGADTAAKLAVGSDGQFLQAQSGEATGLRYANAGLWETIMDYCAANNSDPIDTKLSINGYVVLVYFASHNQAGAANAKSATNAVHTVTVGKTLVVMYLWPSVPVQQDTTNRQVRLQNTTDGTTVIVVGDFKSNGWEWIFDTATPSQFPTVAAGKLVKMQIINGDANRRAIGGVCICKEV